VRQVAGHVTGVPDDGTRRAMNLVMGHTRSCRGACDEHTLLCKRLHFKGFVRALLGFRMRGQRGGDLEAMLDAVPLDGPGHPWRRLSGF